MQIDVKEAGRRLVFTGALDESAATQLTAVTAQIVKPCVFDFAGLSTINSVGVANWLRFMREIGSGAGVTFVQCPPAFVDQMNMMGDFVGKAVVHSVGRYFRCMECSADGTISMTNGSDFGPDGAIQREHRCAKCSSTLDFEDQDEDFFRFVNPDAA